MARSSLGDRGGLDDFREAITLATQAGQGREVALLHNNLGDYALAVRRPGRSARGSPSGDRLRAGPRPHRDAPTS